MMSAERRMREPTITINGATLTEAQAMTARVAATTFLSDMSQVAACGKDEVGESIRKGYKARAAEVVHMMLAPQAGG